MKIISPNYIYTTNTLLSNMALAYEKTVIKIAPLDELKKEFPNANI